MNDTYISTEALNKKLDEAYNKGIDNCISWINNYEQGRYINANPDIACENMRQALAHGLEQLKKHS